MQKKTLVLKGDIIFAQIPSVFEAHANSFIVAENGKVVGIFTDLPSKYEGCVIHDYGDKLIIPGLVDIHTHAPQFTNIGLGFDKQLLPWLETYTFPEESKYSDLSYAEKAYQRVVQELWKQGTTRSVILATIHNEATLLFMDLMASSGLAAYVGKVNMDRHAPSTLIETTDDSLRSTEAWLKATKDRYPLVKPIITPRFVPSCTSELMAGLGRLAKEYQVPVQSHLSENNAEIEWVKKLHPEFPDYSSVYDHYGLFGQQPTIMAHCIHNTEHEIELMQKNRVFVAHCPSSNNNLASGIAPIRTFLDKGIPVGLATDVSGGHLTSIVKVMALAIQVSKLKWQTSGRDDLAPLQLSEAFYMGTKGSGSFFGKVGSFEQGYEFDALIIDDSNLTDSNPRTLVERLERFIYKSTESNIVDRYVAGKKVSQPSF